MYGWRARLGILVPSKLVAFEPEMIEMAPEGVSCHFHRIAFAGGTENEKVVERLKRAENFIADASELITHIRPSVVTKAGTGVSFIGGYGYDQMLIEKMQERNGGLPTTTTTTAVIEAAREIGIKKVSLAMPYLEQVAKSAIQFVQDSGIEVVESEWLNLGKYEIPELSREALYQQARRVDRPESDAVLILCTDLHTIKVIEKLENDLQKPVITSNQATMWKMLRLAGVKDQIDGYGQLLSEH
jgi:maleate isomerase